MTLSLSHTAGQRRVPKWRQTGYLTDCSFSREKDPGFDYYDGKSFEFRLL
jgi:hypothetical protein